MGDSSFYLTLPSNVGGQDNTTAHFRTELPETISLPGEWMVALTEIQYPFSWNNVGFNSPKDGTLVIQRFKGSKVSVKIPLMDYPDPEALVSTINQEIQSRGKLMRQMLEVDGTEIIDSSTHQGVDILDLPSWRHRVKKINPLKFVKFTYNNRRVVVVVDNPMNYNYTVFLSPLLQYMLGFTTDRALKGLESGTNTARYPPDMTGGASSLYVYTNCVAPQIVGNTLAPLLRVVPIRISGVTFGQPVTEIFTLPHYIPVVSKTLNSIDIAIKTDQFKNMQFNYGKSVVKLHFVKKSVRL